MGIRKSEIVYHKTIAGFLVHILTASGAIAGLLSIEAFVNNNYQVGLLWLIFCQLLDGFDGPLARRVNIEIHAPQIDGHILDLVVDYLTCVVVPVVLLMELDLLSAQTDLIFVGIILLTSALWFARTDQETEDLWFNGFPAAWNLVIPSFLILGSSKLVIEIVIISLSLLSLTKVKFPHLIRVEKFRPLTLTISFIYFTCLTLLSAKYPAGPAWALPVLYLAPTYFAAISIWRTWFTSKK